MPLKQVDEVGVLTHDDHLGRTSSGEDRAVCGGAEAQIIYMDRVESELSGEPPREAWRHLGINPHAAWRRVHLGRQHWMV